MLNAITGIPIVVLAIGALVIFFITEKIVLKLVLFGLAAAAILYYVVVFLDVKLF